MDWIKIDKYTNKIEYTEIEKTIECTPNEFIEIMDKRSKQNPTDKEIILDICFNPMKGILTMKIRTIL